MNEEFNKPYDPKAVEEKIYNEWEKSGYFNPDNLPHADKGPFTIALPPPNITGTLHMGHALNATIQDILIRKKRMEGYKALWIPGTDHAGIATQNIVEKQLKKENISRHQLGKEKFLEKIWEWKEKYGDMILGQLKKMGSSCDWSRAAFTMNPQYSKAVQSAFRQYYDKGWIYRGERIVNWCPRCGTSLSDLELEYIEEKSKLWRIKYSIKKTNNLQPITNDFIVVATARPETILGDSAVAVNPKDERYKDLIGKIIILPIQNREIPVVADIAVEKEFGTGVVKVTPAHDFTDAEIGERHKLPAYKIIDERGRMTVESGEFCNGLKIAECREKVIKKLKELNLIEKEEDHTHSVAKCYRCEGTVEPLPSLQWFLKMSELAKLAIEAVESGKVRFHPQRWEKVYLDWLKNIKDWCISRQIWWGHKIPIEGSEDVLDTWFSSALWPFATLGWPAQCEPTTDDKRQTTRCKSKEGGDLAQFYPTQVLSTARDIINLWVARMVYSGIEFMDKEPFNNVIIHATILTKDGKRMSKSLGTGIDPMILIDKYGADATRFGLIWQSMGGQDIHWAEEHVMAGKKFANKLWNISRFVLTKTGDSFVSKIDAGDIKDEASRELLKKLESTKESVNKDIDNYDFGQALHTLYNFVWKEFADKYIEYSKDKNSEEVFSVLSFSLLTVLKTLHPFMPFITEEIYQNLPNKNAEFLMVEEISN
ncbi:MAG: valine--tRNA ligase [Patescibacteria group bacterium]|nr:valine--tRNA ligase [Patescibacteria group bacterium]